MHITYHDTTYDLANPIDISIPYHSGFGQVNAFYAPPFRKSPVKMGDFVGSTKLGGVVNFMNIQLNPHGNGTHTECVGHISTEEYNVNECINDTFYIAELVTLYPELLDNGDKVIGIQHLETMCSSPSLAQALIIRTMPNSDDKLRRSYSGTNPTYITAEAMQWIANQNYRHLLIDLPSVDREEDGGALSSHKIFWNYPEAPQLEKSITELIFVPDIVRDDIYLLKINIANIQLDAVPSRPTIYPILKQK